MSGKGKGILNKFIRNVELMRGNVDYLLEKNTSFTNEYLFYDRS